MVRIYQFNAKIIFIVWPRVSLCLGLGEYILMDWPRDSLGLGLGEYILIDWPRGFSRSRSRWIYIDRLT